MRLIDWVVAAIAAAIIAGIFVARERHPIEQTRAPTPIAMPLSDSAPARPQPSSPASAAVAPARSRS